MRRYLPYLALFAAAVACNPVDPDPTPDTPAAPTAVTLSESSLEVGPDGETLSLTVTAPARPKFAGLPEWITYQDGTFSDYRITVGLVVAVNETYESRSVTVTVSASGAASVTFTVSQSASEKTDPGIDPGTGPDGWENAVSAVLNMGAGWNLGNTLDSNSGDVSNMWIEAWTDRTPTAYETAWGQPVTTRALIHMFKEAGFNAIRVPVTWYPHMGDIQVTLVDNKGVWDKSSWTGGDVDPAWMARVKEVVDYVIDEGMYCILNVHHDTGAASTAWLVASEADFEAVKDRYASLWEQIAMTFRDYGEKLLFESYNEMLDPLDSWCFASFAASGGYDASVANSAYAGINSYARCFTETVRATGGNNARRNLIVNTYAACSGDGTWNSHLKEPLTQMEIPEDPGHIAVEVHSYWEADKFDSQKDDIDRLFSNLDQHLVRRLGVPVIIGEWGGSTGEDSDANVRFASYFSKKAKAHGLACLWWMGLSDGEDRSVPAWSMPRIKNAILEAYQE